MKRDFLRNIKVGESPLPDDIVDVIMAEHGRGIETIKQKYSDYDIIKQQLSEAQAALKGVQDQGTDLETARKNAKDWEQKYNDAVTAHQQELADRDFRQLLESAITGAKGKNSKAITALLDVEALRGSEDKPAAIKAALEGLKKDSGYLFDAESTPPPYSPSTGTQVNPPASGASTLAGALREKFQNQ